MNVADECVTSPATSLIFICTPQRVKIEREPFTLNSPITDVFPLVEDFEFDLVLLLPGALVDRLSPPTFKILNSKANKIFPSF